jgi:hypothetical protein
LAAKACSPDKWGSSELSPKPDDKLKGKLPRINTAIAAAKPRLKKESIKLRFTRISTKYKLYYSCAKVNTIIACQSDKDYNLKITF